MLKLGVPAPELPDSQTLIDPWTPPERKGNVRRVVGKTVVQTLKVTSKKGAKERCWDLRAKVPSCMSKDFPWEVVTKILKGQRTVSL